ncbi:ABC transporter ATP-binding protein [Paenibacillus piri]|uniref:Glutathione import ATP-binding protein GsiA n=1 Tax=Paenibacillus piri TaxID=2547395 RepID=A0A4V2ZSA5_9BACL|nr:oligopeptide/dipeptide ABC transporter ATP-binding protein [Paenibacillus piri]TDF92514.1 ATP-binding cassette domain-containing protein [Paenibacillus piri]
MEPILEVAALSKSFPVKGLWGKAKGEVSAVKEVSFALKEQGTLGIVGESGCGKSTLARLILRLIEPDLGEVRFRGQNIVGLKENEMRKIRQNMQMVFQNPYSSLNPKMTILDNVAFNLWVNGASKQEARKQAHSYLDAVGLPKSYAGRYPHSLSGGQRQRVAIARALIVEPDILIADEAVSALDKSVQAQVLNLFQDLKKQFSLSLLFISHDLNVVEYMSDEVMVMYLGTVVEKGPADRLYSNPYHPYTQALLNSAPSMEVGVTTLNKHTPIAGELPSPLHPPSGCRFRTRCKFAEERCTHNVPRTTEVGQGHQVACLLYETGHEARVVS